jgi:hydroxymethylpyrimidine/phosphomethylpyrimidine kinase
MRGRVLVVAGSDSGGGAGIQADIKTITALGGYAATALTALTAQNTLSVSEVHAVPPDFVAAQMRAVLADIGADALKTGMMHSAPIIEAVCDVIEKEGKGIPLVVDPVLVAKSGALLLEKVALPTLKARLFVNATLLTPNIPEAELLTGFTVSEEDDMVHAAEMLRTYGAPAVLLKGGHLPGATITDVLVDERGPKFFRGPRIEGRHTHGTGCTLASAIAVGLAQGMSLVDSIGRARAYLEAAIRAAPGYGAGAGPIDHGVTVRPVAARLRPQ